MKSKLIFLTLVLFFVYCSQSNQTTTGNSDSTKQSTDTVGAQNNGSSTNTDVQYIYTDVKTDPNYKVEVKKKPTNKSEMKAYLSAFMPERRVIIFMQAADKMTQIKTDIEMAKFLTTDADSMMVAITDAMLKSHPHVQYSGDSEPADDWAWISEFFPFLKTSCPCSECSSEAFLGLTETQKMVQKTEGKADDLYVDVLLACFTMKDYDWDLAFAGNSNNWSTMDGCDFCSYNNLGDGNYTNILNKIIAAENATNAFDAVFTRIVSMMMYAENAQHFGEPKAKVLAEIEKIIPLKGKTKFDLSGIEILKTKIKAGAKDIQFNCKEGNCKYEF